MTSQGSARLSTSKRSPSCLRVQRLISRISILTNLSALKISRAQKMKSHLWLACNLKISAFLRKKGMVSASKRSKNRIRFLSLQNPSNRSSQRNLFSKQSAAPRKTGVPNKFKPRSLTGMTLKGQRKTPLTNIMGMK